MTRAPASVTLVSADDIARFGYRTLADALRGVRGLYVSDDRNYSYLGVRGFMRPGDYNSRILLLVDGHRMNDNLYDGAYFGRDGLPSIDIVERIEFVRGPSSSIYGSSAFFGIVNVVTKQATDLVGARVSAGTASYSTPGRCLFGGRHAAQWHVRCVQWLLLWERWPEPALLSRVRSCGQQRPTGQERWSSERPRWRAVEGLHRNPATK